MKTPILITAVGTTEKAFKTYGHMDKFFKEKFKDQSILWAYSSRFVKAERKKANDHDIKYSVEVLKELKKDGNKTVIVQSLHIIAGYEFHEIILEALKLNINISFGLPLLTSVKDYEETIEAVAPLIPESEDEAAVFVGHGTDHPSWTSYIVFEQFLKKKWGKRVFTGVLKGYPDMDETIKRIETLGFKKVRIIPFMIVAGVHFMQDLTKKDDSWQKTFERRGIKVNVIDHGLGELDTINNIFARHISEAFEKIS